MTERLNLMCGNELEFELGGRRCRAEFLREVFRRGNQKASCGPGSRQSSKTKRSTNNHDDAKTEAVDSHKIMNDVLVSEVDYAEKHF